MDLPDRGIEENFLNIVLKKVRDSREYIVRAVERVSSGTLERLKELRENPEMGFDFQMLLEQLHEKNQAFNYKDKYKRLEELGYLEKEPYFARIDFVDPVDASKDTIYIGKFGFTEDRPVVTDWRAKIASVYYKYRYPQKNVEYETPEGKVVKDLALKRTFEIADGKLVKYYNNDIQLDETEIIVEKIKGRTGGVLEDIIETIQKDQLEIIEADPRQICIVQGCVGSGKSTVAIHKLSHIFFNYPNYIRPERSVLVAKNQILVGYLSTLFPKLGIFDINYKTLRDMVVNVVFREEFNVKVDLDLDQDTSKFNISVLEEVSHEIDKIHDYYESAVAEVFNNPESESFGGYKYSKLQTPYENVNEIIVDLNEELDNQTEVLKENPKTIKALFYKENIRSLRKAIRKLMDLKGSIKHETFKRMLQNYKISGDTTLSYYQTLLYIYFYSQLVGFSKVQTYEYCVVDEGQDFSLLEYAVLSKFVLRGRFGIFGDLNQSLEEDGINNWDNIKKVIVEAGSANTFKLTTNYRSTKQIIDLANSILSPYTKDYLPKSINRSGKEPEVLIFESNEELNSHLKKTLGEEAKNIDKSIGVICFNDDTVNELEAHLLKTVDEKEHLVRLDSRKTISYIPKGIYLMNAFDCKGLEFAKVYIVDLNINKIHNYRQARSAFVAVTRAMNELHIFGVK
ncbi:hypothetical protein A2619_00375 [candidate division WWE3 bacterium RIFOXYD1_FULL_39_9]|uniref:Uncharacterized protein n=1 Tax=candidate division WWE3 bacterium RIFOXYD1_FULL_39_9 TaxID=1802649 RepID=A0A1F4X6E9_UNCKA|nr:MAG: hypothetical protein A2619_00375 [candidate division WWE3 bacterium RIFOXYD1_FULL_39_9]